MVAIINLLRYDTEKAKKVIKLPLTVDTYEQDPSNEKTTVIFDIYITPNNRWFICNELLNILVPFTDELVISLFEDFGKYELVEEYFESRIQEA